MTRAEILYSLNVAANGSHSEMAKIVRSIVETQSTAIADIATDASGTEISVAVNALIAALEAKGIIES